MFCTLAGDKLVENVSFLPKLKNGNGVYIDFLVGVAGMAEHIFLRMKNQEQQEQQQVDEKADNRKLLEFAVHASNNLLSTAQFFFVPPQFRTMFSSLLYYWSIPYDATPKRK